jgi:drug/metabolite transporter (DMT)-like permease
MFARYRVDNLNAIIINYFTCVAAASLFLGSFAIPVDLFSQRWFPYALLMAFMFIIGFNVMALAFQKAGVALTVIIVKMSLILPVVFAVVFYSESLGYLKALGIIAAISAIILVNLPGKKEAHELHLTTDILMLPVLAFVMSGVIEIILYFVQVEQLLMGDDLIFVATSFGMAGIIGTLYSVYRLAKNKIGLKTKDILAGISLGLPNFLTIYLLLYLLKQGWEGSVLFPLNNIGILTLTALVGIIFYNEKMNLKKGIGLILSTAAIFLIGMSQS